MPAEFVVFVTMPGTDEQWSSRFSEPVTVGRDAECEVCLPHPLVSRRHAEFSHPSGADLLIRDLGSRNGTTVDGELIRDTDVTVPDSTKVQVGPYAIVVNVESVPVELTLTLESPEPPERAPFRTIMFTDIEASTALTERLGDDEARAVVREHERLIRDVLRQHEGVEHKTMGDGFMASFSSATRALDAALGMQRALAEWFAGRDQSLRVRIGLNAGEPIDEDDDLHGASVIRAARVMGQAVGGEILVTDVVRQLVDGKDYLFRDRSSVELKGIADHFVLVRNGGSGRPALGLTVVVT